MTEGKSWNSGRRLTVRPFLPRDPRRIINNPLLLDPLLGMRNWIFSQFLPISLSARIASLILRSKSVFQHKGCQNVPIDAHTSHVYQPMALIGWTGCCYIVRDLAAKKVSAKGKCCPGRGKYWHMIYGYKYWRSLVSATERIVESGIAGTVYAGKRRSSTFISIFLYSPVRPSAARNFSAASRFLPGKRKHWREVPRKSYKILLD